MNDLQTSIGDYRTFLRQILIEVADEGFDFADFVQMDHLCYRVASLEAYEVKKQELAEFGRLLGETQVNGRPIATFRLREPIMHDTWRIDTIELPAPKAGVSTPEGLEHVEFVLFDDQEDFLKKYAHKQFEMKSADRGINPEIAFKLPTYTVKFHLLSLPAVVYLENKLGIRAVRDGQQPASTFR
jgi:predicted metalloenzyme YecM